MFDFIMQEILGMHWLSELVWLLLGKLGGKPVFTCVGQYTFFYL